MIKAPTAPPRLRERSPRVRRGEVTIIDGAPLPAAWTGKVWAMHQGIAAATSSKAARLSFLTDADIGYAPEMLTSLVMSSRARRPRHDIRDGQAQMRKLGRASTCPGLHLFLSDALSVSLGEQAKRRRPRPQRVAACWSSGGRSSARAALPPSAARSSTIVLSENCLKKQGPIWLGLSNGVTSLRVYPAFDDIRRMVARSAYAQLYYSPALLFGTVIGMGLIYLAPLVFALFSNYPANVIAAATYALMVIAFQPTLRLLQPFSTLGPCATSYRDGLCGFHAKFGVSAYARSWRSLEGPGSGRSRKAMTVDGKYKSGKSERDENFPVASRDHCLASPRADPRILSFCPGGR